MSMKDTYVQKYIMLVLPLEVLFLYHLIFINFGSRIFQQNFTFISLLKKKLRYFFLNRILLNFWCEFNIIETISCSINCKLK